MRHPGLPAPGDDRRPDARREGGSLEPGGPLLRIFSREAAFRGKHVPRDLQTDIAGKTQPGGAVTSVSVPAALPAFPAGARECWHCAL